VARKRKTAEPAGGSRPAKQVAADVLPSARRIGKTARSINDYAKASPADASGKGTVGYNIHSMRRN
jgi:hypothetical protein